MNDVGDLHLVERLLELGATEPAGRRPVVYAVVRAGTAFGYRSSFVEAAFLGQKVQGMPTVSIARSG